MKVPVSLADAFKEEFQALISQFAVDQGLLPDLEAITNERFVNRSIVPHVLKLSTLFNRLEKESQEEGLNPYWKETSNPQNLRMAYFLYFMPSNLFRIAAIWSELARLGYRWPENQKIFRGIEWGSGPATGACGIAAGETHAKIGLPEQGNWALIEQDKAVLNLGEKWGETYFRNQGKDWGIRPFHRKIDFSKPLLPPSAPTFHIWLSSYFLNESELPSEELAQKLLQHWDKHVENEGLIIISEPALKLQSRKLLALRAALIEKFPEAKGTYQILLPCLGHQACGALANPTDWCHEEVTWWRPPYFRKIDAAAGLDRKTLPFSYLVIAKSKKSREELLPALQGFQSNQTERLVSPVHWEGKDQEFYICGQKGKRKARLRTEEELGRGSILQGVQMRGDVQATRIDHYKKSK